MSKTRHFGWRRQHPDFRDYRFSEHFNVPQIQVPDYVDLTDAFPPVYDQGNLGSCTANALAALCEYDWMKEKKPDPFVPSRLFIYYNERKLEGTIHSDAGAALRDGIKALHKWGFCQEAHWAYDPAAFAHTPPRAAYVEAKREKIKDYLAVDQTPEAMKAALASGFPIAMGFTVYESFMSQEVADTGLVPMPLKGERVVGGHAVVIVGYDTAHWIVRNSWGDGWGKKGYFLIPQPYFTNPDLASDFWVVRMIP